METVLSMTLIGASFLTGLRFIHQPGLAIAITLAIVNFLLPMDPPGCRAIHNGAGHGFDICRHTHMERSTKTRQLSDNYSDRSCCCWHWVLHSSSGNSAISATFLPNSFYVKAAEPFAFEGLKPVARFARDLLYRSTFLMPLLLMVDWRNMLAKPDSRVLVNAALLVLPAATFLLYNTTGLAHRRFQFPVLSIPWQRFTGLLGVGSWREGAHLKRFASLARKLSLSKFSQYLAAALALGILAVAVQTGSRKITKSGSALSRSFITSQSRMLSWNLARAMTPHWFLIPPASSPTPSGFSLIDPIGLTDNVLSGRDTITPQERESYIWGSTPDVYLGPVPAASPGAQNGQDDPLMQTAYVQNILLKSVIFAEYNRILGGLSYEERVEILHFRMRETARPLGQLSGKFPIRAQVQRNIPISFMCVGVRSLPNRCWMNWAQITTRDINNINFDDIINGQERHSFESVIKFSAALD